VLIDVIAMRVMKMAIVKVVYMIAVLDRCVSTIGTVNVFMVGVVLTLLF
jgi:hypothetical protein